MHTLLRFSGPDPDRLKRLGESFNAVFPGFYEGLDPGMSDRFSAFVCESKDWDDHLTQIGTLLDKGSALIRDAVASEILVELDASLHNEDYEHEGFHRTWFELPTCLIQRLSDIIDPCIDK